MFEGLKQATSIFLSLRLILPSVPPAFELINLFFSGRGTKVVMDP